MDHGCGSDRSWILGEAIATSGKVLGRAAGDSQGGDRILLEVGPGRTLSSMARTQLGWESGGG